MCRCRLSLTWPLCLGLLAGCLPERAAFLEVPILVQSFPEDGQAVLEVPLATLAQHMHPFDPEQLAFYHARRSPLRHVLQDSDGDGSPDLARVALRLVKGQNWLVVTCPGPSPEGPDPMEPSRISPIRPIRPTRPTRPRLGATTKGLELDFDAARR